MPAKKASKKAVKARRAPAKPAKVAGDVKGFTQRARLFAEKYVVHGNGSKAALEAGYSKGNAKQQASHLLTLPEVQAYLGELRAKAMEVAGIDGAEVIRRLSEIADADPNELSEVRRVCCRYCHGEKHEMQMKPSEWQRAGAGDSDKPPASWYDPRKAPHPDCPECFGDGEESIFLHDTRRLSPNARRAYAGVQMTKHGPAVKMHDRAMALIKIGEQAGLFSKKMEVTGKGGGAIVTENLMRIEFVEAPGKPEKEPKPKPDIRLLT